RHDVVLGLTDADGFDHDLVETESVHHVARVDRRARESAVPAAARHRTDVHAGVERALFHADAIAEQRAAGVRAGGIDGEDADGAITRTQRFRQLVDERALARARRTGDADARRAADFGVHARQERREA